MNLLRSKKLGLLRTKPYDLIRKYWPILVLFIIVGIFFRPFIWQGKLPIPSDTIVGLYHPYRDLYANEYPNGIPFKNFLITDPVRQQIPWRELSIELLKRKELPLWNPYTFGGTPLLANHQSAPLYPFNVLFFVLPFHIAWSVLILLQPLLALFFMYVYLRNLNLEKFPSLLGALAFAFSGFFIAWLEWGTIIHSALWLPLILLSIDRIFSTFKSSNSSKFKMQNSKLQFKTRKNSLWYIIFIFSLTSSFFAGHLQTFFYVLLFSLAYWFVRFWQYGRDSQELFTIYYFRQMAKASFAYLLFTIVTTIQWIPILQFILESARNLDQVDWQRPGWFIPWQHLIQFVAPDFFGNPATLNYWGEWNYGEFVGYVGMIPIIFALFSLIYRRDKKTLFFGTIFFLALIFSLPTIFTKLPFMLNIPFLSTAQPTRLLFLTDFSLAVLAALGFDFFLKERQKIWYSITIVGLVILVLWLFVFVGKEIISSENVAVANRNLILPTILFGITTILLVLSTKASQSRTLTMILGSIIVGVVLFDLFRFGWKFTPFTNKEYLFPLTKTIDFLQSQEGYFRIMATDPRIFPPNFSTIYHLQSVDGYDPLYLSRYAELIAASERGEPNINPPFGFNRIITPHKYDSKIIDLLGVKYVLSFSDILSSKLTKVFQEGQTQVYENKNALPRVFFVEQVQAIADKNEAIKMMLREDFDLKRLAVIDDFLDGGSIPLPKWNVGKAEITSYSENKVVISTENEGDGFLVLTDSFYPMWKVTVDGIKTQVYRTNYNFRGLVVPEGKHTIEFYTSLL